VQQKNLTPKLSRRFNGRLQWNDPGAKGPLCGHSIVSECPLLFKGVLFELAVFWNVPHQNLDVYARL
jgi:hypothetical protein